MSAEQQQPQPHHDDQDQGLTRTSLVGYLACLPYELPRPPEPLNLIIGVLTKDGYLALNMRIGVSSVAHPDCTDVVLGHAQDLDAHALIMTVYDRTLAETTATAVQELALMVELASIQAGCQMLIPAVFQVGLVSDCWRRLSPDDERLPIEPGVATRTSARVLQCWSSSHEEP